MNLTLGNKWLHAIFSSVHGNLIGLDSSRSDGNLVSGTGCRFRIGDSEFHDSDPAKTAIGQPIVTAGDGFVKTVIPGPGLEITRTFSLRADSPLLECTISIKGTGEKVQLGSAALPEIRFSADFNDAFEDAEDLFFDGAEVGGGHEIPCWRVFFRNGHDDGLIVATRSKLEMSHFQILERGFDIKPHLMVCYDSDNDLKTIPLLLERGLEFSAAFFLGPWCRADHDAILDVAGLKKPHAVRAKPLSGRKPAKLAGIVFPVDQIASPECISDTYSSSHWMKAELPCCTSRFALVAGNEVAPPPIRFSPGLSGVHHVYVGIGNGNGVSFQLDTDPYTTFRARSNSDFFCTPVNPETGTSDLPKSTPFYLWLSGPQWSEEVCIGSMDLTGRSIEISRYPNSFTTSVLDYVRFEPVEDNIPKDEKAKSVGLSDATGIELSGFADTPDIAVRLDPRNPDPELFASNIWEHARHGISKIYWRIDGQCSDYPSKVNTMRYISAEVHGVFWPMSKAYGRLLKKTDLLQLAVKAARENRVKIYGWMRFNSYMGNIQSDFFKQHPEYREESEGGGIPSKVCLAFPEVRKHKIDILVEAAQYGLDGINLGFLRHPPVSMYAPILVEGYEKEYGQKPPRDRANPDPLCIHTLPPNDQDHIRWYQYRARFLTLFMEELRAALQNAGIGNMPVSIWVRPNLCLFDGIDLEDWLRRNLCQEVVAQDDYFMGRNQNPYNIDSEWKNMVQQHVPLILGFWFQDENITIDNYRKAVNDGYDGICTYESNEAVLNTKFIDIFRDIRKASE